MHSLWITRGHIGPWLWITAWKTPSPLVNTLWITLEGRTGLTCRLSVVV